MEIQPTFAAVIPLAKTGRLSASSASQEKGFTYRVPKGLTVIRGQEVKIPFGRRQERGMVIGLENESDIPAARLKELAAGKTPYALSEASLKLAAWIAQEELCTLGQALELFLPPSAKARKKKGAEEAITENQNDFLDDTLSSLEKSGDAFQKELTDEQEAALTLCRTDASPLLLWGVTGSGKTEVYFHRIEDILQNDTEAQVLLLVPEIGMVPQMEERARERFSEKFGEEGIAVVHSKCSPGERTTAFKAVAEGRCRILLGTRSALFAPFRNLNLIILDECHDDSYASWDLSPRYDGRAVAEQLAHLHHAQLIFGSATPHVEAVARSFGPQGDIRVAHLTKRVHQSSFPDVRVVDMRPERRLGETGVLSWDVREALQETLNAGRQTILFLNRRGAATAVTCAMCGWTATCPRCEVPLVHHLGQAKDTRRANVLICHHCNRHESPPVACPECQTNPLRYAGAGTERVELELQTLLPQARIARMDADTTTKKGSHQDLYEALRQREIDVLVGTQIVTKGLDLPAVDLVGIVNADTLLSMPDYRSAERTFQVLSQVVGRTGRRDNPGRVILQTYTPEHAVIQAVANHNGQAFYAQELEERKKWGYPPYGLLARVLCEEEDSVRAVREANTAAGLLRAALTNVARAEVLGPAPAFHARLRGRTRIHVLVKAPKNAKKVLWEALRSLPDRVKIDPHPLSTL